MANGTTMVARKMADRMPALNAAKVRPRMRSSARCCSTVYPTMNAIPAPDPMSTAGAIATASSAASAVSTSPTPAITSPGPNSHSGRSLRDSGPAASRPTTIPSPTAATSTPNPLGPLFSTSAKNSPMVITTPAAAAASITPAMSTRMIGCPATKRRPSVNWAMTRWFTGPTATGTRRIVMVEISAALTRNVNALNQIGSATGRSAMKLPGVAYRPADATSTA